MPCKPQMNGCRADCLHRQLVESYRQAREVWEQWKEDETIGYETEGKLFDVEHPGPTFREWLTNTKRTERTGP